LDGDEIVLVIIVIAVATAIIGAGAYLIWAAPTILGDAAFNAVLASALIHKTKKVSHPEWVGSVLHATAVPFSIVFALTILVGEEAIYPGTCRDGIPAGRAPRAVRFRGEREVDDFVVKRADGAFAYQLAVVVDDAAQGITQVVRGADLLSSIPRQIALQHALG